jgi:hypothetical protein
MSKLQIKFFKYSNSKEFLVEPDVFEYNHKLGKPVFDLIIGCNSMEKLEKTPITVMLQTVELLMNEKGKVMAVVAVAKYGHAPHHKSRKKPPKKS